MILEEIKTYVGIETPRHNKAAVDALGALIQERFSALGCRIQTIPQPEHGNQLRIEYGEGEEQVLILGHFDTVKEISTLEKEPFSIELALSNGRFLT
ncbi:hypothetical protein [Aneurinibacillus tyrosinisolvens]|uniref:hypothetical protein n=1 Tax=Aneurinibacillus tyrosinisolvens TaxID=1443435 RepID=UPI00063FC0C7|nr:hypothetical protein [Aneurinibacillus tyrosinisolvens]